MSTIEDFKNAPVGATARRPGCPVAVKVTDLPTSKGNWDDGCVQMTVETLVEYDYTLDPLPDPEPDWLDAPAVLATCGCRGVELWHPHDSKDGVWVSEREHALWSSLREVTPLYPKGQDK